MKSQLKSLQFDEEFIFTLQDRDPELNNCSMHQHLQLSYSLNWSTFYAPRIFCLGWSTKSGQVQALAASLVHEHKVRLIIAVTGKAWMWLVYLTSSVNNCITYNETYFTAAKSIITIMRNLSVRPTPADFMGLPLLLCSSIIQYIRVQLWLLHGVEC